MTTISLRERADEICESAMMLDRAATNARAFRFLLGNLVGRARTSENADHELAIQMVRAALLRAQITAVLAILDRADGKRGNRASIGHVVELLKEDGLAALLTRPDVFDRKSPDASKLAKVTQLYQEVTKSQRLKRIKDLRNQAIAHLLRIDAPDPAVENEEVSELQNEAERLILFLFDGLGYDEPDFIRQGQLLRDKANLFWETYYSGMRRC